MSAILLVTTAVLPLEAKTAKAQSTPWASSVDGYAPAGTYAQAGNAGVAIGIINKRPADNPLEDRFFTVAAKTNSTAVGLGAKALGIQSTAIGAFSVAHGYFNSALGVAAVARSTRNDRPAAAFGTKVTAEGAGAVAVGVFSQVKGDSGTAVGFSAKAGESSLAAGSAVFAEEDDSVALGNGLRIYSAESIAIGSSGLDTAIPGTIGRNSARSTLMGYRAWIGSNSGNSLALGDEARVENDTIKGVALGSGAIVSHSNSLALGAGARSEAVETGPTTLYGTTFAGPASESAGTVSFGTAGAERQLNNVAAGVVSSSSTNAVNGSQLFAVSTGLNNLGEASATIIGGGSKYDPQTGQLSLPTFTIAGQEHHSVGDAFAAIDDVAVQYDQNADGSVNKNLITLDGGVAGTRITNIASGEISATSTDAVTGQQLYAVSTGLTGLSDSAATAIGGGSKVDPLTGEITKPNFTVGGQDHDNVGGALDALDSLAVKYDQNADGSPNYERVSLAGGTKGSRISNVAAGTEGKDAANIDQLTAALDALGGGAALNPDGSVTGPEYEVGGSKYTTISAALTATNQSAVQYLRDASGNVTNVIQLTGDSSGSPVAITNVADGKNDNDAVNYGQVKDNISYERNADGSRSNRVVLNGGAAGPVTISNLASGKARNDAATYGQVLEVRDQSYAYTDKKVRELHSALTGDIRDLRQEARSGIASVSAAAGLRYDNTPGKASIAAGLGGFKDAVAIAAGVGYTSQDSKTRFNASVGHAFETSDFTWNVGVSWTLN